MRFVLILLVLGLAGARAEDSRPVPVAASRPRVVVVENPAVIDNFRVNDRLLADSLNRAILAYTKKSDLREAWRQFVDPRDVVAIHITTGGGQLLSSNRALVDGVVKGLQAAGVPLDNIFVWDKYADDLRIAGYPPGDVGPFRVKAVIPDTGFDGEKFFFSDLAGQLIWGDRDFRGKNAASDMLPLSSLDSSGTKAAEPPQVSNRSYYAALLTGRVTKIINLPVMSNDERIGMAGCVSSLALAAVDNTRRFLNASDAAAEAIAEIFAGDVIKPKVALNIMDGTLAQYAGGPHFVPYYCAQPGLLYVSRDPVAIDTLAVERIEQWRKAKAVDPVGDTAAHLKQAVLQGIGTNDKTKMEIINLR